MRFSISCLLFFLIIATCGAAAMAQEHSLLSKESRQKKTLAFEDIPDEYFLEAENYANQCKGDQNYRQYYNCECLGNAYLARRIERPDADPGQISLDLSATCLDATEAAGYEFEQCLGTGSLLPQDQSAENYCTCFANTYAKSFEDANAALSSKLIVELKAQAHVTCSDPALAQKYSPGIKPGGAPPR